MEQEKAFYLQTLQTNIRRYGWQSLTVRMTTTLLTAMFLVATLFSPVSAMAGGGLKLGFAVILIMILWITDGHFNDMQDRYADLYRKVCATGEKVDMKISVPNSLNATALWRPIVIAYYLPVMAMLAFLSMSR